MTETTIWLHDDKRRDLFPQIADIHAEQLKAGLLASFAPSFLTRLYRRAAADPLSILIVGLKDQEVVGFAMGSVSPFRFYLGALVRLWPWLTAELAHRPVILGRAASLGKYAFAPTAAQTGPNAELLSIAVKAGHQGTGVGNELIRQFRLALLALDEYNFRVTAADTQQVARTFYRKHGGVVISETNLGGLQSFTYQMPTHTGQFIGGNSARITSIAGVAR